MIPQDSHTICLHLSAMKKQALKTNSSPKSQNLPEKVMLGPLDLHP